MIFRYDDPLCAANSVTFNPACSRQTFPAEFMDGVISPFSQSSTTLYPIHNRGGGNKVVTAQPRPATLTVRSLRGAPDRRTVSFDDEKHLGGRKHRVVSFSNY